MLSADQKRDELLSDEELHDRVMAHPETKERIDRLLAERKSANGPAGITAEELKDFLREHG